MRAMNASFGRRTKYLRIDSSKRAVQHVLVGNRHCIELGVAFHVLDISLNERSRLSDAKLSARIAELRVKPYRVDRAWDYGREAITYPCWTVLEHPETNVSVRVPTEFPLW
jgi:hypothetical protein